MSRLEWGVLPPEYQQGVDRGVLYVDGLGVAWNGLISITEQAVGTITTEQYFDGVRYILTQEVGSFEGQIEAFTYPDEFEQFDGYSTKYDPTKRFDLCYRVLTEDSYKIHILYNCLLKPQDPSWTTTQADSTPSSFTWTIYGQDVDVPGAVPTSHLILDADVSSEATASFEDILYGSATTDPRMATPQELYNLFEYYSILHITYNEDGSWTATGPDDWVVVEADGTFSITSPSANQVDSDTFVVSSY